MKNLIQSAQNLGGLGTTQWVSLSDPVGAQPQTSLERPENVSLYPSPTCCKHEWISRETCQNLPKRLEAAMVAIDASTTEQRRVWRLTSMQMLIFFLFDLKKKALLKSVATSLLWGTDYRLMTECLIIFHFSTRPPHKCVFIMLWRVWKLPNLHISHCIRSISRSYSRVLHLPWKFTLYNSD